MSDQLSGADADRWREGLVHLGFSDDGDQLTGPVRWPESDGPFTARVQITPPPVFPFAPPQVLVTDPGTSLDLTFHLERSGVLCLWEDDWAVDEAPWRDPVQLLDRIRGWLRSTHAGWPEDDSCDLERYLEQDHSTFVLYDATSLVFDMPVRTSTMGKPPGVVVVTAEKRRPRDIDTNRRQRRKDHRLAWVADIGAITRPVRTWSDVADALVTGHADQVTRLIGRGVVTLVLLRYTHAGAPGALALDVRQTASGISVTAFESADSSAVTRGLRAGAAAPRLTDVRVAIIGCGAVGSFTADLLFRSGVRHFTLADGERLRPGNVVRHLAGLDLVGCLKRAAVFTCLQRLDPDVAGVKLTGALVDLDQAVRLVESHQVVVDATGSGRASSLLASAAERVHPSMRPCVISVCVQREGAVLRVDRMPLRLGETHLPALPLHEDAKAGGLRERGCGSPVSPTPPASVLAAAELAVRVVLDELEQNRKWPATVVEVRRAQPEPPFDQPGTITSPPASDAETS